MDRQVEQRVALVTGGARRIGAQTAVALHAAGYRVIIHCRHSQDEASQLAKRLNSLREDSAAVVTLDLLDFPAYDSFIEQVLTRFGRLDLLVNNASSYYPTPFGKVTHEDWDVLMGSNLRGSFFLSQGFADALRKQHGAIINIADIHAERPTLTYSVYCIAKAGVVTMTKALARELGPNVRVNAVAPGAIIWPEAEENIPSANSKANLIKRTPLNRTGSADDIAEAVVFLATQGFTTGQILALDGGLSIVP